MHRRRELIQDLSNRKRICILPKNYVVKVRVSLLTILLLIASIDFFLLFSSRLTFVKLGVVMLITIAAFIFYAFCMKKIKSATIKGDTLIVNSLNKKSKVASLRSIKNVKTKSFAGLQLTSLNYSLDGRVENALFIGHASYLPFSPENTIKEAVKLSKKRKANLKPGPVSAKKIA